MDGRKISANRALIGEEGLKRLSECHVAVLVLAALADM